MTRRSISWLAAATLAATLSALPLGSALARTNSPLLGAYEDDAVVIEADGNARPPELSLGREALAQCAYIRVDRRTSRMTARCA